MNIKTILVTGASGKLGRSLIPALLGAGYSVRATQFKTPVRIPGVKTTKGSMSDPAFIRRALREVDAVCHLATCKEDANNFMDVSVKGTFTLLDEARRHKRIKQLILASGDAALGIFFHSQPQPLDENAPLAAYPGYYAFSKVMEETMFAQYHIQYGLPTTTLRMSWVQDEDDLLAYMSLRPPHFGGPRWRGLATTRVQKNFFARRQNAVGCLLHPGGKPFVRHIVSVADVADAFLLALGNRNAVGQTFNIAGPAPFSYDVLSKHIASQLDLPVVNFICRNSHDFEIDITKARTVLGYQPQLDALQIADRAVAWRNGGGKRTKTTYGG